VGIIGYFGQVKSSARGGSREGDSPGQDDQPEILVACVLFAKTVQVIGAQVSFAAFDALEGAGADLTAFRQLFLHQSFLLARCYCFESDIPFGTLKIRIIVT
jgi:hypothetical protein